MHAHTRHPTNGFSDKLPMKTDATSRAFPGQATPARPRGTRGWPAGNTPSRAACPRTDVSI